MPRFEYKVIPAPSKGQKAKGIKTPEGRFALSIQTALNQLGAEGWEYLRAELLPSDERSGLTGTTVHWRNVLVFRRALPEAEEPPEPAAEAEPRMATGAAVMLKDNGVEEVSEVAGMTTALRTRAEQQNDSGEIGEGSSGSDDEKPDSAEVIRADFERKDGE